MHHGQEKGKQLHEVEEYEKPEHKVSYQSQQRKHLNSSLLKAYTQIGKRRHCLNIKLEHFLL